MQAPRQIGDFNLHHKEKSWAQTLEIRQEAELTDAYVGMELTGKRVATSMCPAASSLRKSLLLAVTMVAITAWHYIPVDLDVPSASAHAAGKSLVRCIAGERGREGADTRDPDCTQGSSTATHSPQRIS